MFFIWIRSHFGSSVCTRVTVEDSAAMAICVGSQKRCLLLESDLRNLLWVTFDLQKRTVLGQSMTDITKSIADFLAFTPHQKTLTCGNVHTCVIDVAGRLHCFGDNSYGQCDVPESLGMVRQVAAGACHTCVIDVAGRLARILLGNVMCRKALTWSARLLPDTVILASSIWLVVSIALATMPLVNVTCRKTFSATKSIS